MNLKRTLIAATLGALAAGATVTAASAQAYVPAHPRQAEVLDRAGGERAQIRHEARTGRISPVRAHRLMVADRRLVMREHRMARHNGGYITVKQQHRLNRQETQLSHRIRG
jgi:hypothetical protein